MPKVSVIVPIYGVEKFLRECVDSILSQTLKDIEIILIDDGGKDNCPQIIDEYAQKDERIVAIHKPNGGYGQTCNFGLEKATGEYVAIVEPDDYINCNMYEDLYNIATKYNSDIVKSCFYDNLQAKEEQRILKTKWADNKIPQDRSFTVNECGLFLQYHPSIWSCIYKREFLKKHNIKKVIIYSVGIFCIAILALFSLIIKMLDCISSCIFRKNNERKKENLRKSREFGLDVIKELYDEFDDSNIDEEILNDKYLLIKRNELRLKYPNVEVKFINFYCSKFYDWDLNKLDYLEKIMEGGGL